VKNFQLVEYGDFVPMFPSAELLINHADYLGQLLLIHTLAPPCLHHKIRSGFLAERVVTEERKDARPLRDRPIGRFSFRVIPGRRV
jgi:hypothetical protein